MKRTVYQRLFAANLPAQLASHGTGYRPTQRVLARSISSSAPHRFQRSHLLQATDASSSGTTSPLSPPSDSAIEQRRTLSESLADPLPVPGDDVDFSSETRDWTRSFHGLSSTPFSAEQAEILTQPLEYDDIEIKPDGIIYLPEIKYRRILNRAFGPGGWGLAPRGETVVTEKIVTREYGLVCGGRLVSIARGEQQYFDPDGIPTATEGCKSNALMRCCKDLGVASELWDPRFIRKYLAAMGREMMVEHVVTKKRRKHWMRKDDELKYPLKQISPLGNSTAAPPAASVSSAPSSTTSRPATSSTKTTHVKK